jgi:hypothetical protein
MSERKDRVIKGLKERQKTLDKLSVKSRRAYTYDKSMRRDSDCRNSG